MKLPLHNILWFVIGVLFWFVVIVSFLYFYWFIENQIQLQRNTEEILWIIQNRSSCNLPYWIQDKIEWIYNNLDTERVNREIEVKCN